MYMYSKNCVYKLIEENVHHPFIYSLPLFSSCHLPALSFSFLFLVGVCVRQIQIKWERLFRMWL